MAGNIPLQERGGSNIGRAFIVSSSTTGDSSVKDLVVGDNVLVTGSESTNARLVGVFFSPSVLINNNSGVAVSGSLLWKDGQGNETSLDTFGLASGGAAALSPNTKLGAFATLAPGESLVLRLASVGYAGGAVASVSYQDLYQAWNARADLSTSLQTMVKPPPGRALLPENYFSIPVILNLDSIPHNVDIYMHDGVNDLLLIENANIAADSSYTIASVGPGNGQALKAMLKEPLSAPNKRVIFIPCYVQYDAPG